MRDKTTKGTKAAIMGLPIIKKINSCKKVKRTEERKFINTIEREKQSVVYFDQ